MCKEAVGEYFGKDRPLRYYSIGLGEISAMVYPTWKGKRAATQMFKTVLTEGIYGLWIERNNRIF